ncbi:MAG: glycosyltransferase family 4 protein [Acholeplasmataceae bacterium]|jgi:1,2-diacylglycerol 3-alpha-glucosyltransferase|nr:glycosyltransferase family 4 protein [Acholeplasmataceae bacterium]
MRIGLFTDSYNPYVSGVSTSLFMLAEGLRKLGHEVFVITTTSKGAKEYDKNYPYIIRFKGIPIPKKGLKMFRYIPFTRRHLKKISQLNLDVIHVHTEFSMGGLALRFKKQNNLPLVYTVHTMYEEYLHFVSKILAKINPKWMLTGVKKLMRKYISKAEVTIVPSRKIKELMHSYQIEGDYQIVPTGIDLTKFQQKMYKKEDVNKLRNSLGIKDDEFVCLFVGRISIEKNIEVLLKGFKKLNCENTKLLIVGSGPHLKNLKELTKKLEIGNKVIFTGLVPWDEIGPYYQIGDVFLNASKSETQGLTYIEALAAGLPLIVKYDKVLETVVEDQVNGLFFYKAEQLPKLIQKISQNKKLALQMAKDAVESVEKYSQENYALNALNVYKKAIEIAQKQDLNSN